MNCARWVWCPAGRRNQVDLECHEAGRTEMAIKPWEERTRPVHFQWEWKTSPLPEFTRGGLLSKPVGDKEGKVE